MDRQTPQFSQQPPVPPYPPPDFSIPPPIPLKIEVKIDETKINNEKIQKSFREKDKRDERSETKDNRSRRTDDKSSSRYDRSTSRTSAYTSRPRNRSREYSKRRSYSRDRDRRRSRSRERRRSRSRDRRKSRSPRKGSRDDKRRSPDRYSKSSRRSPRKDFRESSRTSGSSSKVPTERQKLLEKWRKNYCETSEQITKKLMELANEEEQVSWIRSSPADIYYKRMKDNVVEATPRLEALCTLFEKELLQRANNVKTTQVPYNPPDRRRRMRVCRHKCELKNLQYYLFINSKLHCSRSMFIFI